MLYLLATLICVTGAVAFGLRREIESPVVMWSAMGGAYGILALLATYRLKQQGLLRDLLRFRRGDPTIGILLGLLMVGLAFVLKSYVLPPSAPGRAWLFNIYMLIGELSVPARIGILALAIAEELVWRGFVMWDLMERIGPRRAVPASAVLYAAAHAPTLWTLGDEIAGHNPLLVLAALGAGLVWGYLVAGMKRLWPAMICHAVFTSFAADGLLIQPHQL